MLLLRTFAFFARGEPKYLFIFVFLFLFLVLFLVPHDTGKREIRHLDPGPSLVCLPRAGVPILGVWDHRGGGAGCSRRYWMAINTIIVDDEKPARGELACLMNGCPDIN